MNENQQEPQDQQDSNASAGDNTPGAGDPGAGAGAWAGQGSGQPLGFPVGPTSPGGRLQRPHDGRLVAGVAAGLADHFGIDVTIVRIVIAVLCVMGGSGVPLYLAAWLLIPEEGTDQSIAAEWVGHAH